jgi:hypothetical protein
LVPATRPTFLCGCIARPNNGKALIVAKDKNDQLWK